MNYTNYPQQQYVPVQNQMYKNVPYTWNTNPIPQVRPVSSIEEVRASTIDFDGSVFFFPDIANRKIYTKSVNMDGTVAINLYELKDIAPADQSMNSSYITREEFDNTINQLRMLYEEMLKNKEQEMTQTAAQPTFKF